MRAEASIPANALAAIRAPFIEAGATPIDPAVIQPLNLLLDLAGAVGGRSRLGRSADGSGRPAIKINCVTPNSADVTHHPFQAEIDELVACIVDGRETSISVFDAQKTMEICLAADRSANQGGHPVFLPLISD